jgi:hypothetical protein
MADFRLERLFVILDQPIPGIDHLKAVDAVEFAWHGTNFIADQLGVRRLDEFTYAPFDQPNWHACGEGLQSLRPILKQYHEWLERGTNPYGYADHTLKEKVVVLAEVEKLLDAADALDRQFYFAARDLA